MSNYNAFNSGYKAAVIEPFLPGRTVNVQPIAYEALTPDKFVFLFTTHEENKERYYITYEVDYGSSTDEVMEDIELWSGSTIIEMLQPVQKSKLSEDPFVYIDNIYKVYMCEVDRPAREYWREAYIIKSEEDVEKYLVDASAAAKERIIELLHKNAEKGELTVRLRHDGKLDIYMRSVGNNKKGQ